MAETLTIRPLTREAFAPFGTVIEADPAAMRHINGGNTERYHALAEAEARVRELQAPAEATKLALQRAQDLNKLKLNANQDVDNARADYEKARRAVETAESTVERVKREFKTKDEQRQVRIATIRTEVAKLESEQSNSKAAVERAGYGVERRLIRAPITGWRSIVRRSSGDSAADFRRISLAIQVLPRS